MDVGDIFRGGNASFLGGLVRKSHIDRRNHLRIAEEKRCFEEERENSCEYRCHFRGIVVAKFCCNVH